MRDLTSGRGMARDFAEHLQFLFKSTSTVSSHHHPFSCWTQIGSNWCLPFVVCAEENSYIFEHFWASPRSQNLLVVLESKERLCTVKYRLSQGARLTEALPCSYSGATPVCKIKHMAFILQFALNFVNIRFTLLKYVIYILVSILVLLLSFVWAGRKNNMEWKNGGLGVWKNGGLGVWRVLSSLHRFVKGVGTIQYSRIKK